MFEYEPGSELMTWRLPAWPITRVTKAQQLGRHRRHYLEYEGPVSGNRGEVRRVAAGACLVSCTSDGTWLVTLLNEPGRPTVSVSLVPQSSYVVSLLT
jgi:hypothetical protein